MGSCHLEVASSRTSSSEHCVRLQFANGVQRQRDLANRRLGGPLTLVERGRSRWLRGGLS
jgi:hypothetical protein